MIDTNSKAFTNPSYGSKDIKRNIIYGTFGELISEVSLMDVVKRPIQYKTKC